jgi:adenine phosphoribosyltransferase
VSPTELLRKHIRDVVDFPKPGIVFKDITPLLQDPEALRESCRLMAEPFHDARIDVVAGIESRGFIFAPPVALALGAGFAMARKLGKLPWQTVRESYALEYGEATIEMHRDAVQSGHRVLLIDDVIATGGTATAATRLMRSMGATVVGACFLIELEFLPGRAKLEAEGVEVRALLGF